MKTKNLFLSLTIFLSACAMVTETPIVFIPPPTIVATPSPEIFSSPSKVTVSFEEMEPYKTFTELVGKIRVAAFSNDKSKVAICHAGTPEIVIWDTIERRQIGSIPGFYDCFSVAFSPDGISLATGFYSGGLNEQPILVFWDINKNVLTRGLIGFEKVTDIEFFANGNKLVKANNCSISIYDVEKITSFQDGYLSTRDSEANEPSLSFGCEHYYYNSAEISPDGKILAGGTSDGEIVMWDLSNKNQLFVLQHSGIKEDRIRKVEFSHNGIFLASSSFESGIRVWDVSTNPPIQIFSDTEPVYSISFSNTDKTLFTGSNGVVNVWGAKNGQKLCRLTADTNHIIAVALSIDENSVFGVSEDGQIFIWNINAKCKVSK